MIGAIRRNRRSYTITRRNMISTLDWPPQGDYPEGRTGGRGHPAVRSSSNPRDSNPPAAAGQGENPSGRLMICDACNRTCETWIKFLCHDHTVLTCCFPCMESYHALERLLANAEQHSIAPPDGIKVMMKIHEHGGMAGHRHRNSHLPWEKIDVK